VKKLEKSFPTQHGRILQALVGWNSDHTEKHHFGVVKFRARTLAIGLGYGCYNRRKTSS
jgi:hypothetical protein